MQYGKILSEKQEKDYGDPSLAALVKEVGQATGKTNYGSPELPRWQTEPENLIEDVMSRWLGPIKDEENYEGVQDRLKYLRIYLPRLTGDLATRCDTAIKLLEERVSEYQAKNLQKFISQIAEFLKKPIETDTGVKDAEDYLTKLTEMRPGLRGSWARLIEQYAGFLKEAISAYRERTPQLKGKSELGEPAEPVASTPITQVPEPLRPLWTYVLGPNYMRTFRHTIDSKYAKIEIIEVGKEWRVGFEDRDEAEDSKPDWDYDEPVLHIVKMDGELSITMEKYGGTGLSDIYYGTTRLWKEAGGMLGRGLRTTKTIVVEKEAPLLPEEPTPPEVSPIVEGLKKSFPWIVGLAAIGGTMAIAKRKKEKKK